MKKNKLIALGAAAVLSATAVIGGTMAYFTDTDTATNTFTVGNVKIALHEENEDGQKDKDYQQWLKTQKLIPTTEAKKENTIAKIVTVENTGANDAYLWAEIWVPSALDDGDDNSPTAPGLGNSLHFNYSGDVVETKATYLGSKEIDGVSYNGYVHYVKDKVVPNSSTAALLDQVYMDKDVTQCPDGEDNCYVLMDKETHYNGKWNLIINGIGIQADEFETAEEAISAYYDEDINEHLWQ